MLEHVVSQFMVGTQRLLEISMHAIHMLLPNKMGGHCFLQPCISLRSACIDDIDDIEELLVCENQPEPCLEPFSRQLFKPIDVVLRC